MIVLASKLLSSMDVLNGLRHAVGVCSGGYNVNFGFWYWPTHLLYVLAARFILRIVSLVANPNERSAQYNSRQLPPRKKKASTSKVPLSTTRTAKKVPPLVFDIRQAILTNGAGDNGPA
jgi:hypothetical protein